MEEETRRENEWEPTRLEEIVLVSGGVAVAAGAGFGLYGAAGNPDSSSMYIGTALIVGGVGAVAYSIRSMRNRGRGERK